MQTKLKLSYIVYTLLILPNLIFVYNTFALSYQTPVNVSFTFNPTISVNISNDLTIPSLTPGTTSDSNEINVNVATNNVYGYNLYATVGNSAYNNANLTNTNNNIDYAFTTISPTANLSSLDADNTWGYSYSLDNGSTWSNYNGLPLYATDNPTRLTKNTGSSEDTVSFKISAKAGNTQPSGTYINVINFIAIAKPSPITLADAYASEGKELYHGYYKMQDMTHTICEETEDIGAQLQVIDIRDDKVYWISKLADNNCWMTQNLDLDLTSDPTAENYIALTSENTDLTDTTSPAYQDGYATDENGIITWMPERDTIAYNNLNSSTWINNDNYPYSYDKLSNNGVPYYPDNIVTEVIAGNHALSGNYYNWTAVIASNNSSSLTNSTANNVLNSPRNSICPVKWRLPTVSKNNNATTNLTDEFSRLNLLYNGNSSSSPSGLMSSPLWFIRSGDVNNGSLGSGSLGSYWSSTVGSSSTAYRLRFQLSTVDPINDYGSRGSGFSIRCLAR